MYKPTVSLKAGFLFPCSGVFKNLKSDFQQGFDLAMQESAVRVNVYPEFIQTGALKTVEEVLNKLVLFENVDLVAGIIGTKVITSIIPLLEMHRVPAVISNLGADVPGWTMRSEYLFYNSLHLWKSQWALGKWAQQQYAGVPAINMAMYEAGYGLHECYRSGVAEAGATTLQLNVLRNYKGVGDTPALVEYLRQQQPGHAHILLSGRDGLQFLEEFSRSGLQEKIALTVNPFISGETGCGAAGAEGAYHHALTWYPDMPSPANRLFVAEYRTAYRQLPNVYSLLGYEMGLVLAAATAGITGKINRQELAAALSAAAPEGPRGTIAMSTCSLQTKLPVYIQQAGEQEPVYRAAATESIEWDHPSLAATVPVVSGWQNPYLCV